MIYLDNSATTYPKPDSVRAAVYQGMTRCGANPGRGGYPMAEESALALYRVRKQAAALFGAAGPETVIFTKSCTEALNQVLFGSLKPGDRAVVSDLEHNAVMRPLFALEEKGVRLGVFETFPGDDERTVESLRTALQEGARLVICTAASNVFGIRLPVGRLAALCHFYGVEFCLDAAQGAGLLPLDMQRLGIDYLCVPSHKGLYGLMGAGMLLTEKGAALTPLVYGGTGVNSVSPHQPAEGPERFESGTVNLPGVLSMGAGMAFVSRLGIGRIHQGEMALLQQLHQGLSRLSQVELYTAAPTAKDFVPVLSFNIAGRPSEETAAYLAARGICVRGGLHCAPAAHNKFRLENGTVRVSPSVFTQKESVQALLRQLQRYR